jgi:uncharacterized protein
MNADRIKSLTKGIFAMELTKVERLNYINQFLILEKLYPDSADTYKQNRIALEEGYSLHYEWIFQGICDDFPKSECQFVLDVLDLHRAIIYSNASLSDQEKLPIEKIRFRGFDGNNEGEYLGYARYFIVTLERYDEIRNQFTYPDLNSHMPSIHRYKKMLETWITYGKTFDMSKAQLEEIVG